MRVLLAGGGTAGHINPAIAIADKILKENPDAEILFAGTSRGMESRLIPKAGYNFTPINVRGFQRQLSFRNLKNNVLAVGCLISSRFRAKKIIRDFKPDLVIGTGGYVSGPIVLAAADMGIKTAIHEQNAYAGVTTKLLSKKVDIALLAFEAAAKYLDKNCKYEVVGNPVREDIIFQSRKEAREKLGIKDRICVLSFGGSLGAQKVNDAVSYLISENAKNDNFFHIHSTGALGYEDFLNNLKIDPKNFSNLDIRQYIDDMPICMAAADLIISRAGAITLSEIQATGKPAILIPSPNVAENHQYHNAMVLKNNDAAEIIEEKDLSGEKLLNTVKSLDKSRLEILGKNASKMAIIDCADRIYNKISDLF